jgi:hypothetical protein
MSILTYQAWSWRSKKVIGVFMVKRSTTFPYPRVFGLSIIERTKKFIERKGRWIGFCLVSHKYHHRQAF